MKPIQSILDAHLKDIQRDKDAVIARMIGLSDATYPLLISYLHSLRKLNAVHNKVDDKNETAQMIQVLNYAFEHDFLYFLTLTRQFDVIRKLFQENKQLAGLTALINEIEREHKRANAQNYLQTFEATQKILQREQQKHSESITKRNPDAFNEFLMYQHYNALLQNVTYEHHKAQIRIYEEAYTARLARMNEACDLVLNNPSVSAEDKKALLDMRREYYTEHNNIMGMSITNKDGSPNHIAAEDQASRLKQLHEKFSKFEDHLYKLSVDPKIESSLKGKLGKIFKAEHEDKQKTQEKLAEEERQYQEKVKEIIEGKKENQNGAAHLIGNLVDDIEQIPVNKIPSEQQNEFNASFERLNQLHAELKQEENPQRQKELMRPSAPELAP